MPIRTNIAMALTLTGAIACGLAIQAHAGSPGPGLIHLAQAKERDLRPVPSGKGRPKVTLIPSSKVVPIGGWVNFRIRSSVTGYGHLYVLSASGKAQVWMENVPIAGGQRLTFPVGAAGIRAAPPTGREDLLLIVTRKRIDGFFGYQTTRRPSTVAYSHKNFKRALTEKFEDLAKRQWGSAMTSVRVVDRNAPSLDWGVTGPNYWEGELEMD